MNLEERKRERDSCFFFLRIFYPRPWISTSLKKEDREREKRKTTSMDKSAMRKLRRTERMSRAWYFNGTKGAQISANCRGPLPSSLPTPWNDHSLSSFSYLFVSLSPSGTLGCRWKREQGGHRQKRRCYKSSGDNRKHGGSHPGSSVT